MYIKLRYRARLAQPDQVYELIPEVEDICRSHGWPYRVWDEDWHQPAKVSGEFADGALHFEGHAPLKGVTFQIGDSETVWLTFQADGALQSLMTLAEPTFTADDADFPWQRVKTGADGGKTHLALCKLFRYLADKYCAAFDVLDESGYWDKGGDDAHFLAWMEAFLLASQQLDAELAALSSNDTLSQEEHRAAMYRLMQDFVQRFPKGGYANG